MGGRHRRFTLSALAAVLASFALGGLAALLLPEEDTLKRSATLIVFAQAFINLAAVGFFVVATRHFRQWMQRTYVVLATGISLLSLAQLQLALIVLADLQSVIDSGLIGVLIGVPYLAGTLLVYFSMRRFARMIGVHSWLLRLWVVLPISGMVAVAMAILPAVIPGTRYESVAPDLGFAGWNVTLAFLAALLVGRAARQVGSIYGVALGRLNTALLVLTLSILQAGTALLFVGPNDSYMTHGFVTLPFALTGIVFIWAGIAFNFIGEIDRNDGVSEQATSLQIITYVSSLASDQAAIDPFLDEVRAVSATLTPGQPLTPTMQQQLAATYLKLEAYLTTEEKLQAYTTESLRSRVLHALRLDPHDAKTFWPLIADKETPQAPAKPAAA